MPFPRPKDERVLICILLDGLGYDLVNDLSFLSDLFEDVRPLKTVLGYSCAAQPSILTGLSPVEHGGLCVYYRSSSSIFAWLRLLPLLPKKIRRRLQRKTVDLSRRFFRITGYFNIWEIPLELLPQFQLYERKSFYLRDPIKNTPTIIDMARKAKIPVSTYYWNTTEKQIFSETVEKLAAREAGFHYLYFAKTDHSLHVNGNDPIRVRDELDFFADQIRRIHHVAKENYSVVKLMVFSDHGMMDIKDSIDVMTITSQLPYRLGVDYLAFYDATMVRFWFDNPNCRQLIMEKMANIEGIRLLPDDELEKLGCLFPDRRYGEIIYLTDGGKIISPNFFGAMDNLQGMHGYHPREHGYEAFVGSVNIDINDAKSITDLYWIMRKNLI